MFFVDVYLLVDSLVVVELWGYLLYGMFCLFWYVDCLCSGVMILVFKLEVVMDGGVIIVVDGYYGIG